MKTLLLFIALCVVAGGGWWYLVTEDAPNPSADALTAGAPEVAPVHEAGGSTVRLPQVIEPAYDEPTARRAQEAAATLFASVRNSGAWTESDNRAYGALMQGLPVSVQTPIAEERDRLVEELAVRDTDQPPR